MDDEQQGDGLNRRLTNIEAFAYVLPVLALLVPLVLAIVLPKTNLTRVIFGGWNAVLVVFVVLVGAVLWSRKLLEREDDRSNDSENSNGS